MFLRRALQRDLTILMRSLPLFGFAIGAKVGCGWCRAWDHATFNEEVDALETRGAFGSLPVSTRP